MVAYMDASACMGPERSESGGPSGMLIAPTVASPVAGASHDPAAEPDTPGRTPVAPAGCARTRIHLTE